MNVTDFQEVWQIDVGGQIYEANFEVMAQWIYEGSLLPQDLVRRGNLRWIEARKVPALLQFFNAKERGMPPPVFSSMTDQQASTEYPTAQTQNFTPPNFPSNPNPQTFNESSFDSYQPSQSPFETPPHNQGFNPQNNWQEPSFSPPAQDFNQMPSMDFCTMHPDMPSSYFCDTCGNGFCGACPKSYGGTVKICPFCGAMCKSVKEYVKKSQEAFQYESDLSKGFGFEDFFNALTYPFRFKTSLFFGAIMFMFFTLGQSAGSMGMSLFMLAAAIICWMLANMMTFGVLANTVENFAQGKINLNFMPSFDDFSLWDDVVHPFFLCLGTYIVSFGAFFLIVAGVVYFTWTTFNGKPPVSMEDRVRVAQNELEKRKSGDFQRNPDGSIKRNEDGTIKTLSGNPEPEDIAELQKIVQEQRQKEIESVAGKTPEQEEADTKEMWTNFFNLGLPALAFAGLAFLWGLFYYPAACLVAGYTRSFRATLNPSIGWETIRILGWDYIKILLMCIALAVMTIAVGVVLGFIFFPFNMPGVGNLPAKAVGSLFGFYFAVVFSVFLGYALYKNADKLNLFKG